MSVALTVYFLSRDWCSVRTDPPLALHIEALGSLFKGIVQRNLTGVETRLKKSALLSHYTAQVPFLILKGHHCERSIKPVSAS
jgi:hypothetical protein